MNKIIKFLSFLFVCLIGFFTACKKTDYSFGDLKTPTSVTLITGIIGVDTSNPNGDGSGKVLITASASNAITYNIDFGDGRSEIVPSGVVNHKYSNTGTHNYVITVNAIGTGGTTSVITKQITVLVNFVIPPAIIQSLTTGTSKVWITANDKPGHVGVGPITSFAPDYYAAPPNTRAACLYDDEITFTKVGDNISMTVDNKGESFIIAAATAYYGLAGGDNCYPLPTGGTKILTFMDATSSSTSANSTRLQFTVPGNGLVNFATGGAAPGGVEYEILSITDTEMHLRNIGADGLAWYQILKVKP